MLELYSTLPAGDAVFREFIDRIFSGDPPAAGALPFSPLPGDADAGWLAGLPDRPCGYGWIRKQTGKRALIEIGAHPADIPSAFSELLRAGAGQALDWECRRLVAYVPESFEALAAAYREAGFSPAGAVSELRCALPDPPPEPDIPGGWFLKPYADLRHIPTLAALLHRAYHDKFSRPEYETDGVTADIVRAELEAEPAAEFDYFILLNEIGKGIGVVRCRGLDWIDGPGIVPEERGKGLALPLLTAAMRRLYAKGSRDVRLVAFDSSPAEIDEYRMERSTLKVPFTTWQMELR